MGKKNKGKKGANKGNGAVSGSVASKGGEVEEGEGEIKEVGGEGVDATCSGTGGGQGGGAGADEAGGGGEGNEKETGKIECTASGSGEEGGGGIGAEEEKEEEEGDSGQAGDEQELPADDTETSLMLGGAADESAISVANSERECVLEEEGGIHDELLQDDDKQGARGPSNQRGEVEEEEEEEEEEKEEVPANIQGEEDAGWKGARSRPAPMFTVHEGSPSSMSEGSGGYGTPARSHYNHLVFTPSMGHGNEDGTGGFFVDTSPPEVMSPAGGGQSRSFARPLRGRCCRETRQEDWGMGRAGVSGAWRRGTRLRSGLAHLRMKGGWGRMRRRRGGHVCCD